MYNAKWENKWKQLQPIIQTLTTIIQQLKKALCPYSDKNDKTKNSASNSSQLTISLNIDFFARSFLLF